MLAHELLAVSTKQLWEMSLPSSNLVTFDDGVEIDMTRKEILYSSYFWDLHRKFPRTPLLGKHAVNAVLNGEVLNSDTHIQLLENIFATVVEVYGYHTYTEREPVIIAVYQVTNELISDLVERSLPWVTTIHAMDFIKVLRHKAIQNANRNVEPTPESIAKTYGVIRETLLHAPDLESNMLGHAYRSKAINAQQLSQCIGPRGFVTESDGSVLKVPILRGFAKGLRSLYDLAAESRSAAKAHRANDEQIKIAEYFARRLQIVAMSVENLHDGDCGSTTYMPWFLQGKRLDEDGAVLKSDLRFFSGQWYLDEPSGELKCLDGSETHLEGKWVQFRSVLTCQHPDQHGVCSKCFGALSAHLPPRSNLGHVTGATLTQKTTQPIIGTKHHMASVAKTLIVLPPATFKYLTPDSETNLLYVNKNLEGKQLSMTMKCQELNGLPDIFNITSPELIPASKLGKLTSVLMSADGVSTEITVTVKGRESVLTPEFITFLRERGYTTDPRGNFLINLSEWDFKKPLLHLENTEYSAIKHVLDLAKVIESGKEDFKGDFDSDDDIAAHSVLVSFFSIVTKKIDVNIAVLQVLVYAMTVFDKKQNDFSLARGSVDKITASRDIIIGKRSMSAAYGFERQVNFIYPKNAESFFANSRPDHPMDVFICPREVVSAYKLTKR